MTIDSSVPAAGTIRQAATGMEQFCAWCAKAGEPLADCWQPLTDEFFAVLHPGKTRLVHYSKKCRACDRDRKAANKTAERERRVA